MKVIDLTTAIDLTIMGKQAEAVQKKMWSGHVGTHFDVMNQRFPLEYLELSAIVFDVSGIDGREIEATDIAVDKIPKDAFVAFYSGHIAKYAYGSKEYFTEHPVLSYSLIHLLAERGVRIIGVDFPGVRRGEEHRKADQYCADRHTFIVENLCNLDKVLDGAQCRLFTANTYPLNYIGMTGLPCRVVVRLKVK